MTHPLMLTLKVNYMPNARESEAPIESEAPMKTAVGGQLCAVDRGTIEHETKRAFVVRPTRASLCVRMHIAQE